MIEKDAFPEKSLSPLAWNWSPYLFILLWFTIFCMPLTDAWCSYIDHIGKTPLLIRESAPPSEQKTGFTIQDNLHLFSTPGPSSPFLLPATDYFVSADTIDSNLSLFSLFRNPSGQQDSFANILYANLRLKKLLDEYASIQQRADALLAGSYSSGTMDLMTGRLSHQPETAEESTDKDQETSLSKAAARLHQNLATIMESRGFTPGGNTPRDTLTKKGPATLHELQVLAAQRSKRLKTSPLATTGYAVATGPSGYQQPGNEPTRPEQAQAEPSKGGPEPLYEGSGNVSLPWILDLPFKMFDFALAHKELSIVIGICFLFIVNILFGSRS